MTTKSYPSQFKYMKGRRKCFSIKSEAEVERLICSECKDILVEPHQSDDGIRFCSSCIKDKHNLMYDRAVEKELFNLTMLCINNECKYKCKLRDLEDHLSTCEYRQNKCNDCGEYYPHKERSEHESLNCGMRKIMCKDCRCEMTKKVLEEQHKNINGDIDLLCNHWRGICPCCKEVQDNIKIHLHICPRILVECVMKNIGCTKMIARIEMDDHIVTDAHHHMTLMMVEINNLRRENDVIKYESSESVNKLRSEIKKLEEIIHSSSSKISKMKDDLAGCEKNQLCLLNEANIIKQTLRSEKFAKSASKHSLSSSTTLYGEHTWKIDNILDKIRDAKKGINMQLFSEPFYTDKPGYRMCLKMYPDGDGKRAENFISLYFIIMKGENDDDVSWPFCRKVSLTLLTTETGVKSRTINMKPDRNDNCYGKPSREYNLAAGQPRFISHVELISTGEYIDEGSITIHARVN